MKILLACGAASVLAAVALFGGTRTTLAVGALLFDGKVQPKEVVLNKTPKTAKSPDKFPVPFSHENHAAKNYSADMKSVLGCAECHHTDQPKAALKGVLKTAERDELLTAALLEKPDAKPVKSCAACHTQEGVKPAGLAAIPEVTYPEESDPTILTNGEAYHRNCITCHESVKKLKADTKAPTTCASCHVAK
ncbi:MAG: cytochrome c family protein [Acidobacteria bacterium]|nr:cytochrome c family protein [Acidobacteriota bacterium]MCA1642504.1 cytochrome c family protein [Acidobacteriota bacterium]